MKDLDKELWKLGIYAKTKHNEVAPAQHEFAPIFTASNIAADQNALALVVMKKIALRHGLVCLVHEKPFAGVNGSGKHNNWSIATNDGLNLLDPGKSPKDNIVFLTFLVAIIKAIDKYADLLRLSVASAGNDHRLGANEAPPAVISIFLGAELQKICDALETGEMIKKNDKSEFIIGVDALPNFPKDTTDRNRTSPFAFTGNKFEFRMLGSSDEISCTNMMLNTTVAYILKEFADRLENSADFKSDLNTLLKQEYINHKRVIFNGNGYDEDWLAEAASRGLPNRATTVDAVPHYTDEENVKIFEEFKVLTRTEIASRTEILLENYTKVLNIEALTMVDMARKQILPAGFCFADKLAAGINAKTTAGIPSDAEKSVAVTVSGLNSAILSGITKLEDTLLKAKDAGGSLETAAYYRSDVFCAMQELRAAADELETIVPEALWPYPTYADLLFNV
jgi:glutamine synthetase